jgi:small subunit ribosomal protein S7
MSRSGKIQKRICEPDPMYQNRLVTRCVNRIMQRGKKQIALNLVYKALEKIKNQGKDPIVVLETAINNVGPRLEVRPRRVGGASYQVPMEVRGDRRQAIAIRWIINAAKARNNKEFKTFDVKFAAELTDAANNMGTAIKKRDETHRMAEANKAFAHFRW